VFSERLLIDLIEEYGSIELGVGISSQPSSRKLIETLKAVTNGFLVLNAVYLENQMIRFPDTLERKTLEKDWELPLNWLSPDVSSMKNASSRETAYSRVPLGSLKTILKAHGIKAFLTAEWNALMLDKLPENPVEISDLLREKSAQLLTTF
ncbi:MAG: hypothetical protein ACYC9S_13595, partial [Leptospirales bacterium]